MEMVSLSMLPVLVLLLYEAALVRPQDFEFPVQGYGKEFTNVVVYNGELVVADENKLVKLRQSDLAQTDTTSTCAPLTTGLDVDCDNYNQVLTVNRLNGDLVVCGTGNNGTCEARSIADIHTVVAHSLVLQETSIANKYYFTVGDTLSRPAIGFFVANGDVCLGVTFSGRSGLVTDDRILKEAFRPLSSRSLNDFKSQKGVFLNPDTNVSVNSYLMYFKSGFEINGFSYFITNQKRLVGKYPFVSKLVRICNRVNVDSEDIASYTDIVLSCNHTGVEYNMLQAATVVTAGDLLRQSLRLPPGETVLVATFTKGNDPESPASPSLICVFPMKDVDKAVMEAKKTTVVCPVALENEVCPVGQEITDAQRYYKYHGLNRISEASYNANKDFFVCPDPLSTSWYTIIGDVMLSGHAVYLDEMSLYTKIAATTTTPDTQFTVVYAGTFDGLMQKLNLNNAVKADKYESVAVDPGFQIRAIHVDQDAEYVLSSRKLFKYWKNDCARYRTCAELMTGRDPMCGWCVYQEKSTRSDLNSCVKANLTNHWLSALSECVTIKLQPAAVPIQSSRTINVSASSLPDPLAGDKYGCDIVNIRGTVLSSINASLLEVSPASLFQCQAPSLDEHTNARMDFHVISEGKTIVLASSAFQIYACGSYKGCADCLPNEHVDCQWCLATTSCLSTGTACLGSPLTESADCPRLLNNTLYIHAGMETTIKLSGLKLQTPTTVSYACVLGGANEEFPAAVVNDSIQCNVTYNWSTDDHPERVVPVTVKYGTATVDDNYNNTVTVYKCGLLGPDCSTCRSLAPEHYRCDWCAAVTSGACEYVGNGVVCSAVSCPPPNITLVSPTTSTVYGGSVVTIGGEELGSRVEEVTEVRLANMSCTITDDLKREFVVSKRVLCMAGSSDDGLQRSGEVQITVNAQTDSDLGFQYLLPQTTSMLPIRGPLSGGTRVTVYGHNLGIGNRHVKVWMQFVNGNNLPCTDVTVENVMEDSGNRSTAITYTTPNASSETGAVPEQVNITITIDGGPVYGVAPVLLVYNYTQDPVLDQLRPRKSIASGGTAVTAVGSGFLNILTATVEGQGKATRVKKACHIESDTVVSCRFPPIPPSYRSDLLAMYGEDRNESRRRRQTPGCRCVTVEVTLRLDGVSRNYDIEYYPDPVFEPFHGVSVYKTDQDRLVLKGSYLNLAATTKDYNVTIGSETCSILTLTWSQLECHPTNSANQATSADAQYQVSVTVGNMFVRVGYLRYEEAIDVLKRALIIGGASAGALLVIIVVVVTVVVRKYRRVGREAQKIQQCVIEMEEQIREIAREEFADLQTTMTEVNTDLVERGFPYRKYQEFVFLALFPADSMDDHPLLSEPGALHGTRPSFTNAMNTLEDLISNKYFLLSVITTMDRQRKFFLKDKSNMAGFLSIILLGKMDYFNEIVRTLLTSLVQDSCVRKTHKTLFRRSESITEKLLSNWLNLSLYPHIKAHVGSPLYLLYKAVQLNMESGPIDAVTEDAKYTLSEEKLLTRYSQQQAEGSADPTFEAKVLTLNVQVNNGEECYRCRVLDCDTISQVKQKCLSQIYIHFPASQLAIDPRDLAMEWRAGMGGCLLLRDQDNTSVREGGWVRMNTAAHYNLQDDSNIALIDPDTAQQADFDDYVNLAQIHVDTQQPYDVTDQDSHLKPWHIIKPDEDVRSQEKTAFTELYLPRLLRTKQSILEYFRALLDSILNDVEVPPPVRMLFNLMDELADRNKTDAEVVHAWKSHSFPVRIWGVFIAKPSKVFDIQTPVYLETSLEVISQAFMESFSYTTLKLSKDAPPHKLLFTQDVSKYRERVKEFYKKVKDEAFDPPRMNAYCNDLNKTQLQETRFNKMSALHQFYKQLDPYIPDILQDLETGEAGSLRLGKKLEEVIMMMENEN